MAPKFTAQGDRQDAINNGGTAAISGAAGIAVAGAILAANPGMEGIALAAGGVATGFLAGLGNWARGRGGPASWLLGWF